MNCSIEYRSEDELNRKLIVILERRGFAVTKAAPERIPVGELARRLNRPVSTVSVSLGRPSCPPYECKRGKRRILWIEPNDRLLSFLLTTPPTSRPTRITAKIE